MYPVRESSSTNAFMPHLVGFLGMYCINLSLPLNPNSFIHTDFLGEGVAALKLGKERLKEWAQLIQGIMPHFPLLLIETAVIEVEESQDEAEPISLHDLW